MLTILGRRTSANAMQPLWLADELGLSYEQVDVGGPFGGNDQPEYLELNPTGLVPTIIDDGFVLWESNAIVRYLAARYGADPIYPADLQTRASADQWMDFENNMIMPTMAIIMMGLIRTPPEERNMELISKAIDRAGELWTMVDAQLSRAPFVAGNHFSIGDIPLGPQVHRWFELVEDRPDLPGLEAWYQRLGQRPAFRTHCMNPLA
jgi:glutathione S-transferase